LLDLMGEQLVLAGEPIDYGQDRTLVDQTLRYTPEQGQAARDGVPLALGRATPPR
jgi:hypothetical protein